jgi:hydrogenase nickel incorporation protein HypB
MCDTCGCSNPSAPARAEQTHARSHSAGHERAHKHAHWQGDDQPHDHHHDHGHGHTHEHAAAHSYETVVVNQALLGANNRLAEQNRGAFRALDMLALNVVSSPGSGKTTLLQATLNGLRGRLRCGVIVGDLATDNDAMRLRGTGAPVVQIATGTMCHLEAGMVTQALKKLDVRALDLLLVENVGNLVCPASFDLGEALRVVLLSVTEGEDKPLKYPPIFVSADAVVMTKMDLEAAAGFDREAALRNIRQASPKAELFELSAKTGAGMETWCDYLVTARKKWLELASEEASASDTAHPHD